MRSFVQCVCILQQRIQTRLFLCFFSRSMLPSSKCRVIYDPTGRIIIPCLSLDHRSVPQPVPFQTDRVIPPPPFIPLLLSHSGVDVVSGQPTPWSPSSMWSTSWVPRLMAKARTSPVPMTITIITPWLTGTWGNQQERGGEAA